MGYVSDYAIKSDPIVDDYLLGTDSEDKDETVSFLLSDLITLFRGGSKRYKALLTQVGTSNPTVVVLENTLGASPVITRDSTGFYDIVLADAFTLNKTSVLIGPLQNDGTIGYILNDENDISILTKSSGTLSDGILDNTVILIEVYP